MISRDRPYRVPASRALPRLARDPLGALADIGRRADGRVVRLGLGLFRPYLVTRPDHVGLVLRERAGNYAREGMLWEPLRRLEGAGIAGEGPRWADSRRLLQPAFTARAVDALTARLRSGVVEAVDELDARAGTPVDSMVEMTRIVHRALGRALFGDRLSTADADGLGRAVGTAFASLGARMLLPFVGDRVPLPGDARFRRAVREVDAILVPHIRAARADPAGTDLVAMLARTRDAGGKPLPERWVRDDVVALFIAGTETTALTLTWLWVLLDRHPEVAARIDTELREVGSERLPDLAYTRMVVQEVLRLYPPGWLIPRTARESDTIGGVPVPAGATVLLSPYVTQRMSPWWTDPDRFDPQRFTPGRDARRPRYAYFPFGGGAHQCLGSHLFTTEAQLVTAVLRGRYRVRLAEGPPIRPRVTATLRPNRAVSLVLVHR